MKRIVIYGATDFSKEVRYYLEKDHWGKVFAYVLDKQYMDAASFDGLSVIPYEELTEHFAKDEVEILITLGYSKMNDNRKDVFEKCKCDGWRIGSYIHSSAEVIADSVGIGNIIMDKVELRFHSMIGDGNIFLTKTVISHECQVGNFNYFAGSNHIDGHVKIGSHNFFGTNCIISDNRTVGDYNLIGAGACVGKDLGNGMLAAPAAVRVNPINKRTMDLLLMGRMR